MYYGITIEALAQELGVNRQDVERVRNKWLEAFPAARPYVDGPVTSALNEHRAALHGLSRQEAEEYLEDQGLPGHVAQEVLLRAEAGL